jgi:hypothetical protein
MDPDSNATLRQARCDRYPEGVPLFAAMSAFAALMLGAWAAWRAVRGEPVILRQLIAAGFVELVLLLAVVAAAITQARGELPGDPWVLWGYLITVLFILPVAAVWAFADRTRTSSVALLVACVTVAVMMWRSLQVAGL